MKLLLIATALLSGLALAEKLPAGAACGSNADCNDNCLDSRWAPANQDGKYTFVCDPNLADGTLWYEGICDLIRGTVPVADREKTKSACASLGGTLCLRSCVFSGSSRTPDGTMATWKQACVDAGTHLNTIIPADTEASARRRAGC